MSQIWNYFTSICHRGAHRKRKLKVAFIGLSGVGKSTLINCLLGKCDQNEKNYIVAATGQTIVKNEKYKISKTSTIYFVEFHCTPLSDFDKKKLMSTDHIVVVIRNGFTETDRQIMKFAKDNRKLFSIVRTNIDQDIESKLRRTKKSSREDVEKSLRKEIIENILYELRENGITLRNHQEDIYLVSEEGFRDLAVISFQETDESRFKKKLLNFNQY